MDFGKKSKEEDNGTKHWSSEKSDEKKAWSIEIEKKKYQNEEGEANTNVINDVWGAIEIGQVRFVWVINLIDRTKWWSSWKLNKKQCGGHCFGMSTGKKYYQVNVAFLNE